MLILNNEDKDCLNMNINHDILEVLRQESCARGGEWMQAGWVGGKVENFPTSSHQYRRI